MSSGSSAFHVGRVRVGRGPGYLLRKRTRGRIGTGPVVAGTRGKPDKTSITDLAN